ncbi:hypothetical protein BDY24DRAFT_46913 [Mrakia frigida]|uniref:F-box protein n=1 Tax=Mrakia frigida TaxID=29902 RepID=UPI003FCBEEC0
MLTSIPNELQTHILSSLPRKDLAAVARVSQHLQAVAVKLLYLKVELRSPKHVDDFFLVGSLIPSGSISAVEHTEARRKHWGFIKELVINLTSYSSYDRSSPAFAFPRSLRGRKVDLRIDLERLELGRRHSYADTLLPYLNPVSLVVTDAWLSNGSLYSLNPLGGSWTRLRDIAFGIRIRREPRSIIVHASQQSPFANVRSATMALAFVSSGWPAYQPNTNSGRDAVAFAVRFFPSLEKLRIVVEEESRKMRLESVVEGGFAGKGRDFFAIEVGDAESVGIDWEA